jgi:hypothetical protein
MRTLPLVLALALALLALLALTGGSATVKASGGTATVTTSDGTVQKGVRVGGDKGVEVSGEGLSIGGKKIFGKKEETK